MVINNICSISTDKNECVEMVDVCKNGASCLDFAGGYNCTCLPGFKGEHCDIGQ